MTLNLTFRVDGIPVQQGSKRHVGNGVMIEAAKGLKSWRQEAISAAICAKSESGMMFPLDGPVACAVTFTFPMPASRPKWMRDAAWMPKTTAPDLDKLTRAIGDALEQSKVVSGDARIWRWTVEKIESWERIPGVTVVVTDNSNMLKRQ